jgi:cation diffusion facilitator CzcD-associated flavoprotein CzcO
MPSVEQVETLIIGGGQAGLTMSHRLKERRGSMQTSGVCSGLDKFWAHVTRVGWWQSWCGG